MRQITSSGGMVTLTQSFDPFGNPLGGMGIDSSQYGFAGEWTDGSGLQFLRARYYSPAQGRFISKDPFSGFLAQPFSLNPYLYGANNPIRFTDPSGRFSPLAIAMLLGFIGGFAYNSWQQTNHFTDFCNYNFWEALGWGLGGAALVLGGAMMILGGGEMLGLGLQGLGLGLFNLGIGSTIATTFWMGGTSLINKVADGSSWLFTGKNYPTLIIDSDRMPNIANNIRNAQANGASQILTRTQNQSIMDANRNIACAGFCGPGSPDEYPFASTYEGGQGAYVRGVPQNEQNIQGGLLFQFYRQNNILDGDKFRVIVR